MMQNVTNNFITGVIQVGDEKYNVEEFLKDLKTSVVEMANAIKEVKERLTQLENRAKVDGAQMNEKWNQHQRKIAKLERNMTI
jgi:predicted RNase H-like nuclease (RuvC/YqgF family)